MLEKSLVTAPRLHQQREAVRYRAVVLWAASDMILAPDIRALGRQASTKSWAWPLAAMASSCLTVS